MVFVIRELEKQTQSVILFVSNNTLLVIFKEDLIIFSRLIFTRIIKNPDVLAAFSTDHSTTMFFLFSKSEGTRDKGLWRHNNYFCDKSTYINSMKKRIISNLENFKNENITD